MAAAKKNSDADSTLPPIDDGSIAMLGDVRKGKPRKFAMICKGTSVLWLALFKKGSPTKLANKAKQTFKGQVYYGIAGGKGADLVFQLAISDGFTSEPVRPATLKEFLSDQGDVKCSPSFEIVDTVAVVLDEDDPLVQRFIQLRDAAEKAIGGHPDQRSALETLCRQIASYLSDDQVDQARSGIESLEKLLGSLDKQTPSSRSPEAPVAPTSSSEPAAPTSSSSDPATLLLERIKQLKPDLDRCKGQTSEEARLVVRLASEAAVFGRKKEYAQAHRLLDELDKTLPRVAAVNVLSQRWTERLAEVEPEYLRALQGNPPDAAKLRAVMGFATENAAEGQFEKALQALERLKPLLDAVAGPAGTSETGTKPTGKVAPQVAFQQTRLAWDSTRKQVQAELQKIEKEILATCKDEPDFDAIAKGTKNLYVMLDHLDVRLIDKLDEALQSTDAAARRKLHDEALEIVEEYLDFVEDDDLVQDIDANGFTKTNILATLTSNLEDMARQLQTAG